MKNLQISKTPPNFPRQVLLVTFVVLVVLLVWRLADFLVIVFGAVIVGTILRVFADALQRYARVPRRFSVLLTVVLLVTILGTGIWLVGDPLLEQFKLLREKLVYAFEALMEWLNTNRIGTSVLEYAGTVKSDAVPWAQRLAGVVGLTFGALGTAGLMLVMGIYLAASPQIYRDGAIRLMPVPVRSRFADALDKSGRALSRWLLGQSLSMLFVGLTTAIGLWFLDVPLAFPIGIVSGILAFIPFFGAIVGGLLAVLLGFMQGPQTALYVVILAVVIQQIEGEVLMPLVQRWAVDLPPVLGLASTVMFGVLFGVMGVLLATPMMVVLMIMVQKLYIEGVLEHPNTNLEVDQQGVENS